MATKPLEISFTVTKAHLTNSPEEANKNPIKLALRRTIVSYFDEEDTIVISLIIPEKQGMKYELDDKIYPLSEGTIDTDGVLVHPISRDSTGCTITFKDNSESIELAFDETTEDDNYESWIEENMLGSIDVDNTFNLDFKLFEDDDLFEYEDDDLFEEDDDDDGSLLKLIVPEKANKDYVLEDGSTHQWSEGKVDENGFLVHPISPSSTYCRIKFTEGHEILELNFTR